MTRDEKYPEHAKVRAVQQEARIIGDFLTWLEQEGMQVFEVDDGGDTQPVRMSTEKFIAFYFGIDMERFSREKDAMVDEMRSAQEGGASGG